ncbi:2TM domain-containing protein [Hyphomicrobium sp.]|uniref:2TM domain-containing protein n=1 Tax=Hyphomicrobium sp. TaxID=82 RepID=UPI002D79B23D|nr:2TM domain-containing protein [Hyphomicrobium sp.]HET6389762.1 2TM domain-containing protein [Hyphomicrobium sp.]
MNRLLENQGFKIHLLAYVGVNVILAIINYMNPQTIWFYWVLIGWGIGLAAHGYSVWRAPSRPVRPVRPIRR